MSKKRKTHNKFVKYIRDDKNKNNAKVVVFNIFIVLLSIAVFIAAIWVIIVLVRLLWA